MSRLDAALRGLASQRPLLAALDFDGVLAPLVETPSAARPLPASATAVRALTELDGVTVALVSGRALESLRAVADPPPGAVLVASHGAEIAGGPPPQVPHDTLERVTRALREVSSRHPGTSVETKPAAAVLHTRQAARDVATAATAAALAAVAPIEGAHVLRGKEVVEVSVVRADKGSALLALVDRLRPGGVLYVGDDVTDEHAFRALAGRSEADVTVKVGDGTTAADYRVPGPADVAQLLGDLVALLTPR